METLPDPVPIAGGVVLRVAATGVCLSDWHGWQGHDPDITLPHVPGHELAGIVEEIGSGVTRWRKGDRVTVPFVSGCGTCPECVSGHPQVCDRQFQPGFTHWGSFAQFVGLHYADQNLVRVPEAIDFVTAAALGCRFITSFRAVVAQGRVAEGEWVAVHGCGGVGFSAIMIALAFGARVVAVDIQGEKLALATSLGADAVIDATSARLGVSQAVRDLTAGGAHLSIDALGSAATCVQSIECLRKRGRHVQVGLLTGNDRHPPIPMPVVIANELEIRGSHGMQAHAYPQMLQMIADGRLRPQDLIGQTVDLAGGVGLLQSMDRYPSVGITVIDRW